MSTNNIRYLPQDFIRRETEETDDAPGSGGSRGYNGHMEPVSRPELDAKLEAIEARMDARVASIEGKIDAMLVRMEGRDASYDQRFSNIEESLKDTRAAISNLKTTTIVTAVSAVLAIVFGVAAFNATVLSNMVASFESGKNTAAAQADVKQQARETQQLLDEIKKSVTAGSTPSK